MKIGQLVPKMCAVEGLQKTIRNKETICFVWLYLKMTICQLGLILLDHITLYVYLMHFIKHHIDKFVLLFIIIWSHHVFHCREMSLSLLHEHLLIWEFRVKVTTVVKPTSQMWQRLRVLLTLTWPKVKARSSLPVEILAARSLWTKLRLN